MQKLIFAVERDARDSSYCRCRLFAKNTRFL